ncbi:hypothetical protein Q5530_24210 [Saccharothrix sp. BKS2]|uniref:hypothetical protein n=1 Tax=Saccharothrix sp. BKS2 TaxID=3064400 RepID=UPI0039EC5D73
MKDDDIPGLPERRPIPPAVRARLRADFDRDTARSRWSRPAPSAAVVAAAAATVLVVGAVVVLRQTTDQPVPPAAAARPVDAEADRVALDRCWTAVQRHGATDRYPHRSGWTPHFSAGGGALRVVAATAGGVPLFCQTTPTTATVSDPAAGALVSREGVVAGTTTAPDGALPVRGSGPHGDFTVTGRAAGRLFVALTGTNPTGTSTTAGDAPVSGPPGLTTRDRPDGPEPDRASPAGRLLGECLRDASQPVLDPDSYQPGAHADGVVLGRSAIRMVFCRPGPEPGTARVGTRGLTHGFPVRATFAEPVPGGLALGGPAPDAATGVSVSVAGAAPVGGPAANGTFVVVLPPGTELVPNRTWVRFTARDAGGVVLFDEELPHLP